MNKLLLVDGSALLHRAYHAYPPLRSKSGVIVGAVYGVASMLVTALNEQKPTSVVVAWDLPKPTFRHEMYIGYKAQRKKADSEMVEQIPLVKEMIETMGLVQMEQERYEADDVIGTLSRQGSELNQQGSEPCEVIILTGDQDLMQLVTEQVRVLLPPRGKVPAKLFGPSEVLDKYGVTPDQFVDYKALVGDPSDNIPGVRGIGPKGAMNLISEYESLENIYENIEKISERVRSKLIESRESAELSYKLSAIMCEMEIGMDQEKIEYGGLQGQALKDKLEEMNFRSLIRRIWKEEQKVVKQEDERQMGMF